MGIFARNPLKACLKQTQARHKEASIILSADDEPWRPTPRLLDVAIAAASSARSIEFPDLDQRRSEEPRWYQVWPGEHYRLLAALVQVLGAKRVIEIGTYTGMGALSMAATLPPGGSIATFDILPWQSIKTSWLAETDFSSGRITQHLADISAPGVIATYRELFAEAEFIFIDAPKDGITGQKFIDALGSLELPKNPIVMFDDIRVLNMIRIWRQLARPKMDLTSFGHWSGTGLIDWNGALPLPQPLFT